MSILISGLNLPKDGELIFRITPDGNVAPKTSKGFINSYVAVEVPTPHGRLIDADEILNRQWIKETFDDCSILNLKWQVDHSPVVIDAED